MMLSEICAELRNYFSPEEHRHCGRFAISEGRLSVDFLKNGQYFRIVGSALNDGVYQYPASSLVDEEFVGAVWAMSLPPSLIALSEEIEAFQQNEKPSAFTSESFGGYSYTKATDSNGAAASWQTVFAKRLNQYRRIHL